MMTPHIVPISESHVEGFHTCLDLVARERRYIALIEGPDLETCRRWVRLHIEKEAPYFVALVNDEVVGWCDISLLELPGFTHRGNLGMGVHPAYRGMGIGNQLLSAALEKAQQRGLERVELGIFASNTLARRLYEQHGFVTEGVKKRARKLEGAYDDILEMVLFLSPTTTPLDTQRP